MVISLPSTRGQTYAVLGLGRSGLAAARALLASGAEVWAWDDDARRRATAERDAIAQVDLAQADFTKVRALVLSPGIPHRHPKPHPVAERARAAGCAILADFELLWRDHPTPTYVGITGTNGKSTTTALIGHILKASGYEVQIGGNLGTGALALNDVSPRGHHVFELSSYQLELLGDMRFNVAVLLNISPDHLDRHGGMAGYIAAKRRIFADQDTAHTSVIGVDDENCRDIFEALRAAGAARVVPISAERPVEGGVYVHSGVLHDGRGGNARAIADLSAIETLPGRHNWQNAAAAYAAVTALGVPAEGAVGGLASYAGLVHRQQRVGALGRITFINDSKATNVDAVVRALACYERIYWIAGGQAKGESLTPLFAHLHRVARAFLIGSAAPAFAEALAGRVPTTIAGDLATAVRRATTYAATDGQRSVVLLSPACASFDQFTDFEARGRAFISAVSQLPAFEPAVTRSAANAA